jgi:hypothetical protein
LALFKSEALKKDGQCHPFFMAERIDAKCQNISFLPGSSLVRLDTWDFL